MKDELPIDCQWLTKWAMHVAWYRTGGPDFSVFIHFYRAAAYSPCKLLAGSAFGTMLMPSFKL
ncbi:hypothetical protein GCM10028810_60920 [Spirosoma litoris]